MRGYSREECPFHADVLEEAVETLVKAGYHSIQCLGGGQIRHLCTEHRRQVLISGTSEGFGRADHFIAQALIAQCLKGYDVQVQASHTLRHTHTLWCTRTRCGACCGNAAANVAHRAAHAKHAERGSVRTRHDKVFSLCTSRPSPSHSMPHCALVTRQQVVAHLEFAKLSTVRSKHRPEGACEEASDTSGIPQLAAGVAEKPAKKDNYLGGGCRQQ